MLRFEGEELFRWRVNCSLLSGKSMKINGVRENTGNPGISDLESSYLKLITSLTNGSEIEISDTGTNVKIVPGLIVGGIVSHDCSGLDRSVNYFIEALIPICLFGKKTSQVTFTNCITNDEIDNSVDIVSDITLKLLENFGVDMGKVELKIVKRGSPPLGGGEVVLTLPSIRALKPIILIDRGQVEQVKGVAYSARVSPQFSNRLVDGARLVLNDFIANMYIHTNHLKGPMGGESPGFGISLVAETSTHCLIGVSECAISNDTVDMRLENLATFQSNKRQKSDSTAASQIKSQLDPEEIGKSAAEALLENIYRGGCVDASHQGFIVFLMALGPDHVSKVRFGALTQFSISMLRLIKDALGVVFKIVPSEDDDDQERPPTVLLSCVGCGLKNLSKKIA